MKSVEIVPRSVIDNKWLATKITLTIAFDYRAYCNVDMLKQNCMMTHLHTWRWINARITRPLLFDIDSERSHFFVQRPAFECRFERGGIIVARADQDLDRVCRAVEHYLHKDHASRASDLFILFRGALGLQKLVADLIVTFDALYSRTDSELFDMCRYAPRQLLETMCSAELAEYAWCDEIPISEQIDSVYVDRRFDDWTTSGLMLTTLKKNSGYSLRLDLCNVPVDKQPDNRQTQIAVRFCPCFEFFDEGLIILHNSIHPHTALLFSIEADCAASVHSIQLFLPDHRTIAAITVLAENALIYVQKDDNRHHYCLSLDCNATLQKALCTRDFINYGISTLTCVDNVCKLVLNDVNGERVHIPHNDKIFAYWRCGILWRDSMPLYS